MKSNSLIILLLLLLSMTFAEESNKKSLSEILSEKQTLGPCHTPTRSREDCVRWHLDSNSVKLDSFPEWQINKWRHCCTFVRDSLEQAQKKSPEKR